MIKKRAIFVANIEYDKASGIFKKINGQCRALARDGSCTLICKNENSIIVLEFLSGGDIQKIASYNGSTVKKMISIAAQIIATSKINILYFRLTLRPTKAQYSLFKLAKKLGVRVFYEIPTYPYFFEQLHESKRTILTFLMLIYDYLIFKLSFKYIDRIPAMVSNTKIKLNKKIVPTYNGVTADEIKISNNKQFDHRSLNFIGVGTFHSYHGYERLIRAIHQFNTENTELKLYFHIVGNGPELSKLKILVDQLDLNQFVIFYGTVFGAELDEIYKTANIGVGALALFRRKADIDTTLKVVEYLARGLPVITSGEVPYIDQKNIIFKISNNNLNINLREIVNEFIGNIDKNRVADIQGIRTKVDWNTVMENILYDNTK